MAGNYSTVYDFDRFSGKGAAGSAAPKISRPAKPKLVKEKVRSEKELKKEAKISRIYTLRILVASLILLLLVGSLIYGRVQIMEISAEAEKLQTEYKEAQSENVRLESEVKSMYSIGNISSYAEDKLGMIKKDTYQVNYFSVDDAGQADK